MKSKFTTGIIALILGAIAGAFLYRKIQNPVRPTAQLRLEEILSIRELHLVRHHYNDLFFLHSRNDPEKPVRAIAIVPVSISAYINLKEIEIVKANDSIKAVLLPRAKLNPPSYEMDKMQIRKTRAFNIHAGKDLYPEVSTYLKETLSQRMDSISATAISNKILQQAETEARAYIESLLKATGRTDVVVGFVEKEGVTKEPPSVGLADRPKVGMR